MKLAAHREIEAWGWYVDRLADLAIGYRLKRVLTEEEYERLGKYYIWLWQRHKLT